jgi:hypothetical protein
MGMVFVFVGDIGWGQVVPLFRSAMDGQTKRRMEPIRLEPDLLSLRIWSGSKDMDAIGLRLLLSLRICLEAKIWTAFHGYSRRGGTQLLPREHIPSKLVGSSVSIYFSSINGTE